MPVISGSKHHKAKLDEKSIKKIRKACDAAKNEGKRQPLSALAADYGVSTATIAAVASRRTWKHVAEA